VYWSNCAGNDVMSVALDGGALLTVATGVAGNGDICGPAGVAVTATSLYWTDSVGGAVMRVTPK
jgi:hypothetical protein